MNFQSRNGKKIMASRTFQSFIALKSKKHEMKATEQFLESVNPDNTKENFNVTVANFETEACKLIGASKSVLENVIFCHQEDSLWPFSDNLRLKKIFDELFETKEDQEKLSNMKKSKKELISDISSGKLRLEYLLNTLNDASYKTSEALNELCKLRQNNFIDETSMIQNEIKVVNENIREFEKSSVTLSNELSVTAHKLSTSKFKLESINLEYQFDNTLEELEELNYSLNEQKNEFLLTKSNYEHELDKIEENYNDLEAQRDNFKDLNFSIEYLNSEYKEITEKIILLVKCSDVSEFTKEFLNDKIDEYLSEYNLQNKSKLIEQKKQEISEIEEELNNQGLEYQEIESILKEKKNLLSKINEFHIEDEIPKKMISSLEKESKSLKDYIHNSESKLSEANSLLELKTKELSALSENEISFKDFSIELDQREIYNMIQEFSNSALLINFSVIDSSSTQNCISSIEVQKSTLSNEILNIKTDLNYLRNQIENEFNQISLIISKKNKLESEIVQINLRTNGAFEKLELNLSNIRNFDSDIENLIQNEKSNILNFRRLLTIQNYKKNEMHDELLEISYKKKKCEICGQFIKDFDRNMKFSLISEHSNIKKSNIQATSRKNQFDSDFETKIEISKEKLKLLKSHRNDIQRKFEIIVELKNLGEQKDRIENEISLLKERKFNYEEVLEKKLKEEFELGNEITTLKNLFDDKKSKKLNQIRESIRLHEISRGSISRTITDIKTSIENLSQEIIEAKIRHSDITKKLENLNNIPNELLDSNPLYIKERIRTFEGKLDDARRIFNNLDNKLMEGRRELV